MESIKATSREIIQNRECIGISGIGIKEEPQQDQEENEDEQPLEAYSPLPSCVIKEEWEFGDGHDEINPSSGNKMVPQSLYTQVTSD